MLICATIWMNLKNMLSGEASHKRSHMIYLYEISRIVKSVEREGRLLLAEGWRWEFGTSC